MKTPLVIKSVICGIILSIANVTTSSALNFNDLQSHRAVYEVKLENAEDRSGIVDASGRIVFEVEGNACEGFSTNFRFVLKLSTGRDAFVTDQQTATHESANGKELSFNTKSFVNDQPDQVISGFAKRKDGKLDVKLTGRDKGEIVLEDAIFVTSQLVDIIKSAKADERFVSHDIYDGIGDADEVIRTSTIIGNPTTIDVPGKAENPKIFDHFDGKKAWPITISYFKKDIGNSAESLPFYEASYMLYGDGTIRNFAMKYGDYALKTELSDFQLLDVGPCN